MLSTKITKVLYSLLLIVVLQLNLCAANMNSKEISSAVAKFSSKFCKELDKHKSVVSSPLSAEFLLALLTLGSTDEVHTELLNALDIPNDEFIRSSFSSVSSKLKSIKGVTLNVANKVYIMEGHYELNDSLKKDAVKVFNAEIEKMNFRDAAAAVDTINKWVENKTKNRIKDLLSPESVGDDTRLVLVNALYFKGTWKSQFDPRNTAEQPFHVDDHSIINIPMMYKEDDYFYGESSDLNAQLLRIFYEGEEASMVIILPDEITGLNSVLAKLAAGHDLINELDKMHRTKVQVTLPKFKIETEIDLAILLPKLGIKAIFDPRNEGLSKILNSKESLFVSKAVQKAFIEINEEGAEAAAATAFGVSFCSAMLNPEPVRRFRADKPFLVAILVDGAPYFYASYRGDA